MHLSILCNVKEIQTDILHFFLNAPCLSLADTQYTDTADRYYKFIKIDMVCNSDSRHETGLSPLHAPTFFRVKSYKHRLQAVFELYSLHLIPI